MSQIVIDLDKFEPKKAEPEPQDTPVAAKPPTNWGGWIRTALIVVAILGGAFILRGGGGSSDVEDDSQSVVIVADAVESADKQSSANNAAAYKYVAAMLRDGKIKTPTALLEVITESTQKARQSAFKPIDELDQQRMPKVSDDSPEYTEEQRKQIAKYFEDKARGFERNAR